MQFIPRDMPPRSIWALEQAGVHPLLARLYAARGISQPATIDASLAHLLPPTVMPACTHPLVNFGTCPA